MVSAIPTPRSGGGSTPRKGRPWTTSTSSTSGGKARTRSTPQERTRVADAGASVWERASAAPKKSPPGTTMRHASRVTTSPRSKSPELSAMTSRFRKVWKNSDTAAQRVGKRVSSQRPTRTRGRKRAT